jgi:hypothetical protein
MTQMGNEPVYVNAGETPGADRIYYHSGLDFGGAEGVTQVVSAIDGIVISAGPETAEHLGEEGTSRADVVYLKDHRGWYYLYSHLYSIDESVTPGQKINMGDPIGLVGKEGSSGGWAHLHFGVSTHMSSGEKGALDAYPFIWQAYQEQHQPAIMAVARPHKAAWTGQKVELDASGSWSQTGTITSYEWTFCDGSTGRGAQISKVYTSPGEYSEVVKISDSEGHVAFDFAVVIIADPDRPERKVPRIHLTHEPTQNIRVGDEIVFKVRSMNSPPVNEKIDFGDNSPVESFPSDGNIDFKNPEGYVVIKHRYTAPGEYIVTASRIDVHGQQAVARVWITVDDGP